MANSIRLKFYLEVFRILFTNRFLGLENQSGVNPNGEKQTKTTMNATQSRLRENSVHYNHSKILTSKKIYATYDMPVDGQGYPDRYQTVAACQNPRAGQGMC